MIPEFHIFKRLELNDQSEINSLVSQYPPYSDYNFLSLWNYDTENLTEISILNGNLVVRFTDYITSKPFYSFIGDNKIGDTVSALLTLSGDKKLPRELSLIPEISNVKNNDLRNLNIMEDLDNFDYILSVDEIAKLEGNKYRGKRNFVNRFIREYGKVPIVSLNLQNTQAQQQIEDLFFTWEKQKQKPRSETEHELTAIRRLFLAATKVQVVPMGIYIKNKLAAFILNEVSHQQYAVIHFEKADIDYVGISSYLKQAAAKKMNDLGCKYINYQQDLGIEGLRKSKLSWRPVFFLKKYKISQK